MLVVFGFNSGGLQPEVQRLTAAGDAVETSSTPSLKLRGLGKFCGLKPEEILP